MLLCMVMSITVSSSMTNTSMVRVPVLEKSSIMSVTCCLVTAQLDERIRSLSRSSCFFSLF